MVGRTRELARLIEILNRRTKCNPILLGDPGVGKTAVAEGLALAIAQSHFQDGTPLPPLLAPKRIYQLDLALLLSGCKERGELEGRVIQLVKEASEDPNVILLIDEVHMLVGAGKNRSGSGNGVDISNILKPPLARGEIQVIGATTIKEHRQYFEKDAALERRF